MLSLFDVIIFLFYGMIRRKVKGVTSSEQNLK